MKNSISFKVFGQEPKNLKYKYSPKKPVIFVNAVIVKTPIIAFDFSGVWLERIEQLELNLKGLKEDVNNWFTPGPTNPTLIDWEKAIGKLAEDELKVEANAADYVPIRNADWVVVKKMARKIVNYVFDIADANPEHAAEICSEAKLVYFVREGREQQKPSATAKSSTEVEVLGSTKKTRVCTDYQICKDPSDEKNWLLIKVFPTSAARTIIKNLEKNTDYYTRSCIITKDGPEPWEPVIKVTTKKSD